MADFDWWRALALLAAAALAFRACRRLLPPPPPARVPAPFEAAYRRSFVASPGREDAAAAVRDMLRERARFLRAAHARRMRLPLDLGAEQRATEEIAAADADMMDRVRDAAERAGLPGLADVGLQGDDARLLPGLGEERPWG